LSCKAFEWVENFHHPDDLRDEELLNKVKGIERLSKSNSMPKDSQKYSTSSMQTSYKMSCQMQAAASFLTPS